MSFADKLLNIYNNIENALRHCNDSLNTKGIKTTATSLFEIGDKILEIPGGGGDNSKYIDFIERNYSELIDEQITTIADFAVISHPTLSTINLQNCSYVGQYAFMSCYSLT